jgi:hypothetical protein
MKGYSMEWMDGTAKIIGSLASFSWPVVVILLARMFKRDIKDALPRIREVVAPGTKITLDAVIEKQNANVIELGDNVAKLIDAPEEKRNNAVLAYSQARTELDMLIEARKQFVAQLPRTSTIKNFDAKVEIIIRDLGVDRIADMTPEQLVDEWPKLSREPQPPHGHVINGGMIAGLAADQLCGYDGNLTLTGAKIFVVTAKQMKAGLSSVFGRNIYREEH